MYTGVSTRPIDSIENLRGYAFDGFVRMSTCDTPFTVCDHHLNHLARLRVCSCYCLVLRVLRVLRVSLQTMDEMLAMLHGPVDGPWYALPASPLHLQRVRSRGRRFYASNGLHLSHPLGVCISSSTTFLLFLYMSSVLVGLRWVFFFCRQLLVERFAFRVWHVGGGQGAGVSARARACDRVRWAVGSGWWAVGVVCYLVCVAGLW